MSATITHQHTPLSGKDPMVTTANIRVLASNATIPLPGGKVLRGSVEHYPQPKSLMVFDPDGVTITALTVPTAEAGTHRDDLNADEVLLRNWTDMRGAPEALASRGLVELTGQKVQIGPFRLEALVARVR